MSACMTGGLDLCIKVHQSVGLLHSFVCLHRPPVAHVATDKDPGHGRFVYISCWVTHTATDKGWVRLA